MSKQGHRKLPKIQPHWTAEIQVTLSFEGHSQLCANGTATLAEPLRQDRPLAVLSWPRLLRAHLLPS